MLSVQSPVTGTHLIRPKSGRRPLQPIRSTTNAPTLPNQIIYQKSNIEYSDKENPKQNKKPDLTSNLDQNRCSISKNDAAPVPIEQFEVSLADELCAIRQKMERLRSDKEKTEKMLRERKVMMEMKMKEILHRCEIQKALEIEVDRLYRLNQLRSLCDRMVPIRSLREKEQEKIKPDKSQASN
ncbi:hypothetical protein L1987_60493 [Smallanthus sonchifolius]|uniref:Uncharacterized protein n=1 Tax=Smallanthus sonchifolius TaxID=185202 RepID=A0ACB9D912_9ASTR|nr:hypothetical protein L1987_60493 [Smallanthus sonchifolius]